jgi:hypothetical protein
MRTVQLLCERTGGSLVTYLIIDHPDDDAAWHEVRPFTDLWDLGLSRAEIGKVLAGEPAVLP